MDSREFIRAIKISVRDTTINGSVKLLERPVGRKPDLERIMLSEWYNDLDSHSKHIVSLIIKSVANMTIFNFLCVIDGVISIEDIVDKGNLKLFYTGKNEELLNPEDGIMLHDLYNDKI
jgi:hypothetical protein